MAQTESQITVTFQRMIDNPSLQLVLNDIIFMNNGDYKLVKYALQEEENKIILTYE